MLCRPVVVSRITAVWELLEIVKMISLVVEVVFLDIIVFIVTVLVEDK